MSTSTRPYKVIDRKTEEVVCLVEATNEARVLRHMADKAWAVTPVKASEAVKLVTGGTPVHDAAEQD